MQIMILLSCFNTLNFFVSYDLFSCKPVFCTRCPLCTLLCNGDLSVGIIALDGYFQAAATLTYQFTNASRKNRKLELRL